MSRYPKPTEGSWTQHYPALGTEPVSYEDSISPEFYELERKAIFERAWLQVGRVEQLPRNGSYFTKDVAVANTNLGDALKIGFWKRDLTRDDLRLPSPYNTYVQNGLPPGPICSPGLAALEAVGNGVTCLVEAGTVAHPERVVAGIEAVGVRSTIGRWGWDIEQGPFTAPAAEKLTESRQRVTLSH